SASLLRPPPPAPLPYTPLFRSVRQERRRGGIESFRVLEMRPVPHVRHLENGRVRDERRHLTRRALVLAVVLPGRDDHRGRLDLRSEEHTSELQSRENLVCRLLR